MFEIFVAVVVFGLLIMIAIFVGNCVEIRKKGKTIGLMENQKLVERRINEEICCAVKRAGQIKQFVTEIKYYESEMPREIETFKNKCEQARCEIENIIEEYRV